MTSTWILSVLVLSIVCQLCSCHPISEGPTLDGFVFPSAPCIPEALGMEDGSIPDSSLTASSVYSSYRPSTARLNVGSYGWKPSTPADQWIQVDLGKPTVVTGLTMQGRNTGTTYYVRAFSVQHSLTAESDDWQSLANADGGAIRFTLSSGRPTNVTFPVVPFTRFVRILPLAWEDSYYYVRFEVFGCQVPDGHVRLVNGTDDWSGRVEIYRHETGTWGVVCGNDWGINDANTVCRQLDLGFASKVMTASEFGGGDLPIMMNRVACEGTESRLVDCPFICNNYQQCESSNVAGVVCNLKNTVRLEGGPNYFSGRVEIFQDFTWGTICDRDWDITDAGVVCRQLGYIGAEEANSGAHYGEGSGPVHMKGVACTGSEGGLVDCPSHCWTATTCSHSQDAGVICIVESSGFEETNSE
ncbi:scavenger receptor cysteine-rich domain superfamily protein-like [Patiria miniata]|uniref:Deleted in malignant brain tumors 1 protein-like n=1 Tax=Patiria miniata TaxID=46514 RepID=A0A913ZR86_PATMI|nr:scavenger receptor cysteine-rich domain superfamily protein-like [Patiria miniata]XP_038054176.1 scavenger receptor cysteine-rich domain superfamily protein-like [Patiria miniata]XP_038054177.1 scavenger receptor cysteine-rich domain superfamily protein-like [Patiria miniata]